MKKLNNNINYELCCVNVYMYYVHAHTGNNDDITCVLLTCDRRVSIDYNGI